MPLPTTANTTNPRGLGYGVRIGDHYYRLAYGATQGAIEQTIAEWRVPIEDEPEEVGGSDERSKTHAQNDFTSGEGLAYYYHPDNDSFDKGRFWRSHGVYTETVSASKYLLRKSGQPDTVFDPVSINAPVTHGQSLVWDGSALFAIENQRVARISNPDSNSPSVSYETPSAGVNVSSLALLGEEVWATTSSGQLRKRTAAGTWTAVASGNYDLVWSAKGRLICAVDNAVTEYGIGTIFTLPAGDAATSVADAGTAILIGASNGLVYAARTEDGSLTLKGESPFDGQYVTGVGSAEGLVLVGTVEHRTDDTTARLYAGVLAPDYTLKNVRLWREWDVTGRSQGPQWFRTIGSQVYFFVGDGDVWRADLASTGLFHHFTDPSLAGALGVAAVGTTLMWRNTLGNVIRETDDPHALRPSWLVTSLIDLFDSRDKMWQRLRLYSPSGDVAVYYSTNPAVLEGDLTPLLELDHTSWTELTLDADDEALIGAKSRWIAFKFVLGSVGASSDAASLRGYSVSAYPGADDLRMQLPILVSDRVERRGRRAVRVPGLGDRLLESLWDVEGSATEIELIDAGVTLQGTVERVEYPLLGRQGRGSATQMARVTVSGERQ